MTAGLRTYPECTDSGVAWLGGVPGHWQQVHGRAVLQQKWVSNRGMVESTVLSLSHGRVVVKPPEKLHGLVPESFETYQVIDPGDIIVRPTDLQNDWTTIRVGIARDRGIITSAYLCFLPREPLRADYAHLLLLGYDLKKVFYGMGSGLRQNLDWSDFKRLPVLLPPPDEQEAIVAYVSQLDSRVRRFIRNRRRLIELLNEQKQAIITRAVTRGLDPNVPLRPSGIDWLGDVPEHWDAIRLKYRFGFREGPGIMAADFRDAGVPLLRISCLAGPDATLEGCNYLDPSMVRSRWRHFRVQPGDYLLSASASTGGISRATEEVLGAIPYTGIIRLWPLSDEGSMGYLRHFISSQPFIGQIEAAKSGVGIEHFGPTHLKRMWVSLPPRAEQDALAEHLDGRLEGLEQAVHVAEREIGLIREYRTRLIADVVTGKVDVRHLAPEAGEVEDELEELGEEMLEGDASELVGEVPEGDG